MEIKTILTNLKEEKISFDTQVNIADFNQIRVVGENNEYLLVNDEVQPIVTRYGSRYPVHEIKLYYLQQTQEKLTAKNVGYLRHHVCPEEIREYNLEKIEITDRAHLNKGLAGYAIKFFEEFAVTHGYHYVYLDFRPDYKDQDEMYIINEDGEEEHRASYTYRINGYKPSYDDRMLPIRSKGIEKEKFLAEINVITEKENELTKYKNIKTWKHLLAQAQEQSM